MNRSVNSLIGFTMHAKDGEIGKVEEMYFDDDDWTVRYVVVKMGSWLLGRKVLISPQALQPPDWEKGELPVNLFLEQVRRSPDIDTDKPVSRQEELRLYAHYPWQEYWGAGFKTGGSWGIMPAAPVVEESLAVEEMKPLVFREDDPHLRSTHNLTGYSIHATDGEIGKVADFIIDDADWTLKFLVVRTGSWTENKNVLLSTRWIKEIRWADSAIVLDISVDMVKKGPAFEFGQLVNEAYEQKLFDHYGKPIDAPKRQFVFK